MENAEVRSFENMLQSTINLLVSTTARKSTTISKDDKYFPELFFEVTAIKFRLVYKRLYKYGK